MNRLIVDGLHTKNKRKTREKTSKNSISQPPVIRGESEEMKRKTYNNVLKAGKLIQKKGYEKQESLEMAVKLFDQLEALNNGMPVEWLIDKLALKQ